MSTSDPFQPRAVVGRRTRPAKEALGQARIVDVALGILEREGRDGLSLRKVARALETGPASLYVYVANLEALHALLLDRALADVEVPKARSATWRKRLHALLRSYLLALANRPGLAHLALAAIPAGPNTLRVSEALLDLLDEAGLPPAAAAWALDLLLLYVTALAAELSNRRDDPAWLDPISRAIARANPDAFPRVHAARAFLTAGSGDDRFAWAVDVLVNGLLAARAPKR